jgi:hypothetical protein
VSRRPRIDSGECNQILAIWASDAARAGVLAAAAEEAQLRNAGLILALPPRRPGSYGAQTEIADYQSATGDLAQLAERYPALAVAVDRIDPRSVSAVSSALSVSCLAVVGYRHSGHLTSGAADLANSVLRQATCPLLFPLDNVAARPAAVPQPR